MIIELHAIQSFAPSNLNRDDTGNPKEALFGGVRRARISSQSAKRAMRVSDIFAQAVNAPIGIRTKHLASHVARHLREQNKAITNEWAMENMIDFIAKAKYDKKPDAPTYDGDSDELVGKPGYCFISARRKLTKSPNFCKNFGKPTIKSLTKNQTSANSPGNLSRI